jgi:3'-phosphoadenosine 5'-phosphosulfate sulfotransferase (PAPS reductase)/FAD synthetase
MKPHEKSAISLLNLVRQQTDKIGIGISFGKDSLTTLDLCSRVFKKIYGYYLFRVRDISLINDWKAWTEARYGIEIMMLPHFDFSRCYSNAVLRPHIDHKIPKVKMKDIEDYFKAKTGVEWFAYGWLRNDSFSRALIMKQTGGFDEKNKRVFPLRAFKRSDVLQYLDDHNIPRPPSLGRDEQGGLDFHPEALRTLKEQYPDDWARWQKDFPFAGLQLLENQAEEIDRKFA